MKNLLIVFSVLLTVAWTPSSLQEISKAFGDGNASALMPFLAETVEVSILDDANLYDKAEAVGTLNDFFKSHKPTSYSHVHQGSSKGKDSKYVIGDLKTANGNYRVYIYMMTEGSKETIQELRIDTE